MNAPGNQSIKYAFEPFSTLASVLSGEPIKIMPLGKFYRDDRTLTITEDVLKQMESNFKSGLPRFRVPINENHEGVGKVGTVQDIAFMSNGPDGAGLYATKYELTDIGKKLITDGRFDAVSPEVVWTMNDGAQYQDPKDGSYHTNVLVGLALTDRPYFSHDEVALFSATKKERTEPQEGESMADTAGQTMPDANMPMMPMLTEIRDMLAKLVMQEAEVDVENKPEMESATPPEESFMADEADEFKQYDTAQRREMAGKGEALPDGSFPIADKSDLQNAIQAIGRGGNNPKAQIKAHILKRAKALGATDLLPPGWAGSTQEKANSQPKEVEVMADEPKVEKVEVSKTPEELTVKAEDFKAMVEKAKLLTELQEQMKATMQQAEDFKAKLAQAEYDRDLDRMVKYAEGFLALPVKSDDLGKKLLELKRTNADLFGYFDGLLKTADQLLMQTDLFGQRGTQRTSTTETFEALVDQVLKEKFSDDRGHYSEAMQIARERRPDLMNEYLNQPRGAGR